MAYSCHVTVVITHDVSHDVTWEKHTQMEYQCSSLYFSISISADLCYNFIFKRLIDQVILNSQICIYLENVTLLRSYERQVFDFEDWYFFHKIVKTLKNTMRWRNEQNVNFRTFGIFHQILKGTYSFNSTNLFNL